MRIIAILIVVMWQTPCAAQLVDGNRALRECEAADKNAIDYFVAGVVDTAVNDKGAVVAKSLRYSMSTTPVPAELTRGILKEMRAFCVKEPVDPVQLRETVCGYLKSNPNMRNVSAAKLATEALHAKFPCTR